MAFTPGQRALIKKYLGYPNLTGAELLNHGTVIFGATEMLFTVEANMDKVPEEAEHLVLEQLEIIKCVEQQVRASYMQQIIASTGSISFNGFSAILATTHAYVLETDKLADLLHSPKASTSLLHNRIGGTGEGAVREPC